MPNRFEVSCTIMPQVSIITPFFNEEGNLPTLRSRLASVLREIEAEYEIVLVDDHSTDGGSRIARDWAGEDPNVQYLRFSRNFGAHAALSAGLRYCTGDCAILMAADLQDPPETIPLLMQQWRSGHDVVWATRSERRGVRWTTKVMSRAYYWLMKRFVLPNTPSQGADFLLMDRKVIDAIRDTAEKNVSIHCLVLWMGFRQTSVEYAKEARHQGSSKWTLAKKLKLLVDSMVSFSYAPIRLMSGIGAIMALSGFCYALVVVVGRLTGYVIAGAGFAALMTVLLVGQGLILFMLGVLGEYAWRTLDEARNRPGYLIEEHIPSGSEQRSNANRTGD
jgi:dolichol-phosphate mannosyltransferase